MTDSKKLSEEQLLDIALKHRTVIGGYEFADKFDFAGIAEDVNAYFASQVAAPSPATEQDLERLLMELWPNEFGDREWIGVGKSTENGQRWEALKDRNAFDEWFNKVMARAASEQHQDALVAAAYQDAKYIAGRGICTCGLDQQKPGRHYSNCPQGIALLTGDRTPAHARAAFEEEVRKARMGAILMPSGAFTKEVRDTVLVPADCKVPGHFKFQENGGHCMMCQRESRARMEAVSGVQKLLDSWIRLRDTRGDVTRLYAIDEVEAALRSPGQKV